MSVILPQIPARLRRMLGRFVGPAGAALFSLVLASCAGGGFGGAPDTPAVNPASQPAPAASGPISPASQRNVAEALSGLKLGDETPPISPEDIAVSDDAEILNRNPFSSSAPAARASGWGARADSTRKTQGYKAFEVAVPSENPLMTVAVWISETPPDYPEGKPEQDPESDRKFLYLRLQVFIAVGHVALVEGGGVEVLDSQVIVVEEKRPDPKPQPKPQPVTLEAVTAETVCESGSLSANGLTQAQLDYEFLGVVLENDLEEVCNYLRRGANIEIRTDQVGRPHHRSEESATALMIAGRNNYSDLARLLLSNGADVDSTGGLAGGGWAALHIAAYEDHADVARVLLDGGGDVNVLSSGGDPPLYQAAHWGRADMVQLLLSRGADPDIQANTGVTPLHGAATDVARSGSAAVVSLLLSYDADPNLRRSLPNAGLITRAGETGHSPLDDLVARGYGNYAEAARILRDAGGKCFVRTSPLCGEVHVAVDFSSLGAGTVSAEGDGDALSDGDEVRQGATVMFTATPAAGHYVSGWSGDCAAAGEVADGLDGAAKFCAAAADSDLSVRAEFSEIPSLAGPLCPSGSLSTNGLTQAQLDAGLISAAKANNLTNACEYLRRGANIEVVYTPALRSGDAIKRTPLVIAAANGRLELSRLLLNNGANVNWQSGRTLPESAYDGNAGWSALALAAAAGRGDVVGLLLDRGANVDIQWDFGRTALHEAAIFGRASVVELLLARGAAVDVRDLNGETALHGAAWGASPGGHHTHVSRSTGEAKWDKALDLLLDAGAEVNLRSTRTSDWGPAGRVFVNEGWNGGWTPLDRAVAANKRSRALKLRSRGGFCNVQSGPLCPTLPVTVAVTTAVTTVASTVVTSETVCESGSLSANGLTQAQLDAGLITAARDNDLEGACEYLRRSANIEAWEEVATGFYRKTPLIIAGAYGRMDLARLLLNNGADVDGRVSGYPAGGGGYRGDMSALIWAASHGHADMIELLLDSGAEVDGVDSWGGSALLYAGHGGMWEAVELLLSRGADANLSSNSSLVLYSAVVGLRNMRDLRYAEALMRERNPALDQSWAKVVSLLLDSGAEVNARLDSSQSSEDGFSSLDFAAWRNYAEVAELLRDAGGKCFVQTGPLCGVVEVATPDPVTLEAVTSETVCESGSLSANGQTQAQLNDSLIAAADGGDLAGVCEHLRRGAEVDGLGSSAYPNTRRWSGWSALMVAAGKGRLEVMRLLLANGAQLDGRGVDGWTALHRAAGWGGQVEAARLLLDRGASVDAQADRHGAGYRRPLYEAAHWGRADVAELLLAHGADANAVDVWDITPLHGTASDVAQSGSAAIVSLLLSHGANLNPRRYQWNPSLITRAGDTGHSPLDDLVARGYGGFAEAARILRDAGGYCYVETGSLCAYPPVTVAVTTAVTIVASTVATAETICESGSLSANGLTQAQLNDSLIAAADGGDLAGVCEHLRRGAEVDGLGSSAYPNTRRWSGWSALMVAAGKGRLEVMRLLLANGAQLDGRGVDGWTALHRAAGWGGQVEAARLLLDRGASVDAQADRHGAGYRRPLYEAAHWGRADVAELLLAHGADANAVDVWDITPLHGTASDVAQSGSAAIVSLLLSHGANLNPRRYQWNPSLITRAGDTGHSPLDDLVARGYGGFAEAARILRDAGGYCYVETRSLCAYPPVTVAVTTAVTTVASTVVTAETVCESGSLSANGLTQAQLDAGLISAARDNDLEGACEHLRKGANIEAWEEVATGFYRKTPLIIAGAYGRMDLARLLLNNGADVDGQVSGYPAGGGRYRGDMTALLWAAWHGHADMIELLLDRGAEIDRLDSWGGSPLMSAGHAGMWEVVEMLLSRGADANLLGTDGQLALYGSVRGLYWVRDLRYAEALMRERNPTLDQSWAKVVSLLLDSGAEVNARLDSSQSSEDGFSSLDFAAWRNYAEVAELLRNAGGYCYVQTNSLCAYPPVAEADSLECPAGTLPTNGLTAAELNMTLRMAARGGDATRVCEALRRGAEVNDNLDDSEFTPLQEAVSGGHLEAVKVLLANGAEVNKRKDGAGHSPLDLAARDGEAEIAALLRNANGRCFVETGPLCQSVPVATPDPVTVVNTVAATVAATVANTVVAEVENTVAATVAAGSCPAGTLDANGMTQAQLDAGLLDAVWESEGETETICEYLRRGANVDALEITARSHSGSPNRRLTGLMMAAIRGWPEVARLLLDNGADPDRHSGGDASQGGLQGVDQLALNYAAAWGHVEIVRLLLDHGANINMVDAHGRGGLFEASFWGRWDIVNLLLERGANPQIQDKWGWSALHGAAHNRRTRLACASHSVCPVASASANPSWTKVVSVLLSADVDVNARLTSAPRYSPLDEAVRRNHADFAAMLRAAGGQCFVSTSSLCGSAPAPAAAAAESAPATDRLRESFAGAFNPSPAFGDAFGAASGSSERFLSRLDSLMRSTSGSGGNAWDSFAGWQRENEHGRMWFSTGQRGDFGFGAGVGGAGGDLSASPFAAMVGNGMLAGGETGLGAAGKLRIAAFADYQARSLLDGTDRQWTKWAASGTAIETAMTEAERFSGLAENQTRGAMTEIHLGGGDLGVALQAGAVSESDAMLSGTADDENLRGLRARTAFAGLSGAADLFGSGWRLRGSAHLGRSWAESERMLRDGDLWASAFSAGLERGGWLYSDDGFILRFSQPLRVESLEMDLIGADGASRLGADPSGRQLDVDAAYRLPLSGGGWLLLSAGVRRDGGHTSSSDLEAGALFSVERGF